MFAVHSNALVMQSENMDVKDWKATPEEELKGWPHQPHMYTGPRGDALHSLSIPHPDLHLTGLPAGSPIDGSRTSFSGSAVYAQAPHLTSPAGYHPAGGFYTAASSENASPMHPSPVNGAPYFFPGAASYAPAMVPYPPHMVPYGLRPYMNHGYFDGPPYYHSSGPASSASSDPSNSFETTKHRRRTTKSQFKELEGTFVVTPKPSSAVRKELAEKLGMPPRAVQIWFQNRRAKAKAVAKKKVQASGGVVAKGAVAPANATDANADAIEGDDGSGSAGGEDSDDDDEATKSVRSSLSSINNRDSYSASPGASSSLASLPDDSTFSFDVVSNLSGASPGLEQQGSVGDGYYFSGPSVLNSMAHPSITIPPFDVNNRFDGEPCSAPAGPGYLPMNYHGPSGHTTRGNTTFDVSRQTLRRACSTIDGSSSAAYMSPSMGHIGLPENIYDRLPYGFAGSASIDMTDARRLSCPDFFLQACNSLDLNGPASTNDQATEPAAFGAAPELKDMWAQHDLMPVPTSQQPIDQQQQ